MLTAGVDLAAQARDTAIALVDWSGSGARLRAVVVPGDDRAVEEAALRAGKTGLTVQSLIASADDVDADPAAGTG